MKRSRSPAKRSRDRSFNLSSTSSDDKCNNKSYSSSHKHIPTMNRDRNKYRGTDKNISSHPKEHYHPKDRDHSNTRTTKNANNRITEKSTKNHKEDEPEDNYLSMLLNSEYKVSEECMDPSICNFQVTFEENNFKPIEEQQNAILHTDLHFDSRIKDISDSEKRNSNLIQEKNSESRLNRLEKLVEMLINCKSQNANESYMEESSSLNVMELKQKHTALTTSMWLSQVNDECLERNLDDRDSIQYMHSKMCGIIKTWFNTLELSEFTFSELKMLIVRTFPDHIDFAQTLRLLVERMKQPDETITHYYFSKLYLLEHCKISSTNAVSCIIDGLMNPIWQQEARMGIYSNPEILYTNFLSRLPNHGLESVQDTPVQHIGTHTPVQHIGTLECLSNYSTDSNVFVQDKLVGNVSSPEVHNSKSKKICNVCRKYGHIASQCKLTTFCFTCGKPGHITIQCRHAPICYICNKQGHIAANCKLNDKI